MRSASSTCVHICGLSHQAIVTGTVVFSGQIHEYVQYVCPYLWVEPPSHTKQMYLRLCSPNISPHPEVRLWSGNTNLPSCFLLDNHILELSRSKTATATTVPALLHLASFGTDPVFCTSRQLCPTFHPSARPTTGTLFSTTRPSASLLPHALRTLFLTRRPLMKTHPPPSPQPFSPCPQRRPLPE